MIHSSIITFFIIGLCGPIARGNAESDAPKLEGTWKPQSAELAGKPFPQPVVDSMKLTLKGETYLVDVGGQLDEGKCTHDSAKSPKTIDITGTKGPNEGKTFLAIYELKGDEFNVCYDLSGKSRPTEFATKPGTKLFLVKYRRVKE